MKKYVLIALCILPRFAFAADEFVCELNKKILVKEKCTVCAEMNADGDCIKEEVTICNSSRILPMGIQASVLHMHHGSSFSLAEGNNTASFILAASNSGYSAIIRSKLFRVDSNFESSRTIDPMHDRIVLTTQTKFDGDQDGAVTHLQLECMPR